MATTKQNGQSPAEASAARVAGREIIVGVPPELVEAIAERAADLVARRDSFRQPDGWLRGAEAIAAYIDCKPDRVYALSSAGRIPVHHDGSALIARRSELDEWIRNGGGRRP